jgi:3-hydroxybutyrate dehydrogenase
LLTAHLNQLHLPKYFLKHLMTTALITGSTSGIGKAIATAFAKLGYNIIFNGLEPDGKEIAAAIANENKIEHLFFSANMLDPIALNNMVQESIAHFGKIDILVNNAGIQFVSPVQDFPEQKWNDIIGINLTAPFLLTKAVWPSMVANQFGRIINISSAHGLVASANKSAYVASKHGIIGFTKTIALEGAPHQITCNAICPGYVHTPIIDKQIPEQMKVNNMTSQEVIDKIMLAKQAVKEFIPAGLIADACVMMASQSAKTITGIALPIDGGWTAE